MRELRFRNLSLATKIVGLAITAVVPAIVAVWVYVLPVMETRIWDERISATKNIVDIPYASNNH